MRLPRPRFPFSATAAALVALFGLGAAPLAHAQSLQELYDAARAYDGSYLSASDPRVHVGLGASSAIDAVVIRWPDGTEERRTGIAADRLVTLNREKPAR